MASLEDPADFIFPDGGNAFSRGENCEDGWPQLIIVNIPKGATWEWRMPITGPRRRIFYCWPEAGADQTDYCRDVGMTPMSEEEVLAAFGSGYTDIDIGPDDGV